MAYKLKKPVSIEQRMEFLVKYNDGMGLRVLESDTYMYALLENERWNENTQEPEVDPDYKNRVFETAKEEKFKENLDRCHAKLEAGSFTITVGSATIDYVFNDNTKNDLSAAAIGFLAGIITEKEWTGENGVTVKLSQENVAEMLITLDTYGNPVWAKWGDYENKIKKAKTKAALDKIIINYDETKVEE